MTEINLSVLLSLLHDEHQRLLTAQEENAALRHQVDVLRANQPKPVPRNAPEDDPRHQLVEQLHHLRAAVPNGEGPAPEAS
jgi:hypothetical protein